MQSKLFIRTGSLYYKGSEKGDENCEMGIVVLTLLIEGMSGIRHDIDTCRVGVSVCVYVVVLVGYCGIGGVIPILVVDALIFFIFTTTLVSHHL